MYRPTIDVPFRMKQVAKGMCNRALPEDASVSTLLDNDMLKAMFSEVALSPHGSGAR